MSEQVLDAIRSEAKRGERSGDATIAAPSQALAVSYGSGSEPMNVPQLVNWSRFFFEIYSVAIQTVSVPTATAAE